MDLTDELKRALETRDDAYTRHLYAADASLYALEPLAVAFPRNADEVSRGGARVRRAAACRSSRAAAARASRARPPAGAGSCSISRAT